MRARLSSVVVVLVLVATACSRDEGSTTSAQSDSGSATTAPASAATGSTTAPEEAGLDAGAFGDLGVICRPGNAEPIADQTGIDGTTISLGTVSDRGFAGRPGLDEEFNDAAEAFTAWCNEHGGIQGYELETVELDAKFTEYQSRMVEACDEVFALVGGGGSLDNAQEPRLECGLPDFPGFAVTDESVNADLHVAALPNGGGTWEAGSLRWLGERFPDSTDAVATIFSDFPLTRNVNERNKEILADLGWTVLSEYPYNPAGESNWKPFAQAMKDQDVQGIIHIGEPQSLAALLQAAQDIEFEPQWVRGDANHYDTTFTEVGGSTVDGTYVRIVFWPFERASENLATQQYLDMMERYNPSGKIALLGATGLSAWLLFATSLDACIDAGTVTRDCVYSTAKGVTEWTGGGLHVPTDPSSDRFPECYTIVEASGGAFVQAPVDVNFDRIFNCDPANVFELENTGAEAGVHCPSGVADPLPSTCPE